MSEWWIVQKSGSCSGALRYPQGFPTKKMAESKIEQLGDDDLHAIRAMKQAEVGGRRAALISAAKNMDWEQIVLNHAYGPPCFHLEDGQFCGRAKSWFGHDGDPHDFVSFENLLRENLKP